jgi:hypothetical protein
MRLGNGRASYCPLVTSFLEKWVAIAAFAGTLSRYERRRPPINTASTC